MPDSEREQAPAEVEMITALPQVDPKGSPGSGPSRRRSGAAAKTAVHRRVVAFSLGGLALIGVVLGTIYLLSSSSPPPPWEAMARARDSFPFPESVERGRATQSGERCKGKFMTCDTAMVTVVYVRRSGEPLTCDEFDAAVAQWEARGYEQTGTSGHRVDSCASTGIIDGFEARAYLIHEDRAATDPPEPVQALWVQVTLIE